MLCTTQNHLKYRKVGCVNTFRNRKWPHLNLPSLAFKLSVRTLWIMSVLTNLNDLCSTDLAFNCIIMLRSSDLTAKKEDSLVPRLDCINKFRAILWTFFLFTPMENILSAIGKTSLTLYHTIKIFDDPEKEVFWNIVGKGENACNHHYLLFPQYFLPFLNQISKLSFTIIWLSVYIMGECNTIQVPIQWDSIALTCQ